MEKKYVLVCFLILLPFVSHCQRIWEGEYNRLGLKGGINHFNIHTGNFNIEPGTSWTAGFTVFANYHNNFQFIYGLNFFDFIAAMEGRKLLEDPAPNEKIQFNMIGVQASFLGSYKIIGNYLSVEAGPVLQVNGQFEPRQDRQNFYVQNYDIQASNLEEVSTFNFNVAAGISGGFENIKLFAQYQYGINNFFGGLDEGELEGIDPRVTDISGSMLLITGGIIVFL